MKGYSIYRDNTVIYEFVVDDTISKSLSGNKYVSFTISSKNDLDLKIGDYVLVGNEKYEIFEPIDIEESNGVFTYPLTFYFQGYKLNNSIITDEGATTFAYHGEVSDFMTLLIDSLNEDYPEFTLGTIQNGSILDLSFDNSNCMAALQTVCENAKMEWDITGTIITVKSRIGEETDHVFEYGRNKGSYSVKLAKVANASITTRMIGKGGTLNLPADYVSPDSPKRLNLGNEVLEKNVNKYGKITGVYINENIYPRLINKTVLGVTIPDNIEEAGSWKIKLDIPFNLSDYYADNEVPVVKFQTGDLTGLDFEIVENSWNNTDKTLSIIVKEEEDGYYLPNANRQPRVGDVFVLLNINMPQSYIDEAIQELREATQNELNKKCEPQYAPSLSVQKHYIRKKGISLNIGDGITVKIGSRNITTRIIGTTETSDDIRVEFGDQMLYTYDTKVNNTIEQIQFTLKQLINIDDIKRLFYNLINAWYPKWFNQKLHKDADVEFNSVKAAESVQSDNFSSKNFTSGAFGSGHRIKDGNAEFQNLTVRGQFSVFEFLIQQVKAIGGKFCVSPAAIKTGSVEETENGYKCFFNTDSGTIMNPFVVGDQAFHQVFDGQKMKRYWRLVTEVGADYFVLSKTDCEENSGIPEADEEIVLLGNRTDINRQSAIMISAYDNNSPYIAFYAGINSYSFEGKEPMRTGNLNGIVDEDFGQLTGFGLYCQNVYMKGVFRLMSGKTVEESIGDVQSNLDNLQIGGVNILKGSTTGILWNFSTHNGTEFSRTDTPTAENSYIYSDYIILKGDTEIVLSFYAKHVGVLNSFDLYILPDDFNTYGLIEKGYQSGEDWVYNVLKLKTPSKWGDGKRVRLRIDHNGSPDGSSATIYVKDVQIEYGNKATTYSVPESDREVIAKQHATDIAQAKADLAETRANAYADGIVTEAEQNAINEAQARLDALQIGSQNLISKKMMLKWNEKNKDIAVWGEDEDGVYLAWDLALMRSSGIATGAYNGQYVDIFENKIKYKTNTQYVISIESKSVARSGDIFFYYTDGSRSIHGLSISFGRIDLVSTLGKTVEKICFYIGSFNNPKIYNISLIEGNKPLQGFPVAAEDQTEANNVNLADGTKGPFTVEGETNDYAYKALYMPVIKPNTVYYVNAQNIEFLSGNISKCDFILFDKAIKNYLTPTYHHLYDKNGGILITKNDFEAQEGYLLCYAGESGHTAGNSVRFTEVMLVEGFLPAPVWTPSHGDVGQSIQDAIAKTVDITAPSQVFKYGAGYTGTPSPASIVLTALPRNFTPTSYQWQYLNGSTWTNISGATSSTYSVIPGNTTLFPSGTNVRTFRVVCDGDEKLSDSFTLAKLADGAQGAKGDKGDTGAQGIPGESINGKILYKDPEFKLGMNGVEKYSNSPNVDPDYIRDKLTVERIAKPSDAPTQSRYCLKITCKAAQLPGYGGVYQRINSRANAVFVQKIIAKIPVGYAINTASNSMGTGYTDTWLTSTNGTGKYTTYLRKTVCGATGTFYTGGHVYITGNPTPSESEPLEWYIASMTCFDQTADGYSDIEITTKDSFAAQLGFTNFEALKKNAVNSENGTLIQGGYINTNLIKADALIAIDGFIDKLKTNILAADSIKANMLSVAGFNFADYKIYGGAAYGSGSGIQITSTTAERSFKAYKDTNNYIGMYYNSATDWGIKGVVGGATYLQLGDTNKIAGLELSNNGLRSSDFNPKLMTGSCYAKDGFSVYASGSGVLTPSTGGMQAGIITAVGDFISHITGLEIIAKETSYNYGSSSKVTALRIQAENRYYGTPFDPPLAIEVVSGDVLFGGKMTVNNTSIFRGQIYLNLNNIPNISGASNYYLCINRSTGRLSYR